MSDPRLRVAGVSVTLGRSAILRDVDLAVPAGSWVWA